MIKKLKFSGRNQTTGESVVIMTTNTIDTYEVHFETSEGVETIEMMEKSRLTFQEL